MLASALSLCVRVFSDQSAQACRIPACCTPSGCRSGQPDCTSHRRCPSLSNLRRRCCLTIHCSARATIRDLASPRRCCTVPPYPPSARRFHQAANYSNDRRSSRHRRKCTRHHPSQRSCVRDRLDQARACGNRRRRGETGDSFVVETRLPIQSTFCRHPSFRSDCLLMNARSDCPAIRSIEGIADLRLTSSLSASLQATWRSGAITRRRSVVAILAGHCECPRRHTRCSDFFDRGQCRCGQSSRWASHSLTSSINRHLVVSCRSHALRRIPQCATGSRFRS